MKVVHLPLQDNETTDLSPHWANVYKVIEVNGDDILIINCFRKLRKHGKEPEELSCYVQWVSRDLPRLESLM